MASVPSSPQKDLQDLRKSRRESVVPDRPSLLSPTTPVSSPLASTSWGLASTSSILISKKVSRKSSKNSIPPLPQNGAYIRRGSTSAALMNSSNSLWQTLVKTKHGPFPGIDATKDSVNNNDPKASLIEKKKAALSRRTNSLVELAAKTSKQSNEKSEESLPSTHSSPLRPNGLLKRDMRFCCSFRRPRRAKTSSNLLENKNKQPNVPPFGLVNASAMSLINDPSVARQAISLLEAQMKPNPETVKMLVEEEKAVEEGQEVKRPHGLESITSPLRKLSKAFFNSQNNDRIGWFTF
ncbi:unnamed protein product [Bursaphelenchus xylophilus]|uniref:(pine wood nematode) hypothetical protein n=1 Tax=Bursaphelenchus xylophilus TaxID=6326 RepID=A0A1I7SS14_BURXY|nr:unnamed protein product [Bursaphelenchus xylophilus]CAG9105807.1 unnamed protein product [Bursaphelenchus xylophilus]